MNRHELIERNRRLLLERRATLRGVIAGELSQLGTDQDDESLDDEAYSQMAESESHELELIEEALLRIGEGRYGTCQDCGVSIPLARLQALPYAALCVKCQRATETDQPREHARVVVRDWFGTLTGS